MKCTKCDKEFDPTKPGFSCNDPECPHFTLKGLNDETRKMANPR